ncbi:unnamed protein product [Agarophyton chilense]
MAFVSSYTLAGQRTTKAFNAAKCGYLGLARSRLLPPRRLQAVQFQTESPSFTPYTTTCMASSNSTKPDAKELAKLYGGSYLATSVGLSIISYLVLYAMVAVGVDVRTLMNTLGDFLATTPLGRPSVIDNISDTASTAALAYIAHKAMSPLRFPLTVAATPVVAKLFSKNGSGSEETSS